MDYLQAIILRVYRFVMNGPSTMGQDGGSNKPCNKARPFLPCQSQPPKMTISEVERYDERDIVQNSGFRRLRAIES